MTEPEALRAISEHPRCIIPPREDSDEASGPQLDPQKVIAASFLAGTSTVRISMRGWMTKDVRETLGNKLTRE